MSPFIPFRRSHVQCTVLIVLMSLAIALIQWLVGERKLGRRSGAAAMPAPH